MKKSKFFVEFTKSAVVKNADGTLTVAGYASANTVDLDGETITTDCMKRAAPGYMKFGAVREMHQPSAVGTALKIEPQEDGKTLFECLVVDPTAILKVEKGVYKGFSVGGTNVKRNAANPKQIDDMDLIEVSLVDRPCNGDAVITVFKVAGMAETSADEVIEPPPADAPPKPEPAPQDPPAKTPPPPVPPVPDKEPPAAETATKSFSLVGWMASLLQDLKWVADEAGWEAEYDLTGGREALGLVASVREASATLGEALKALVAFEVDRVTAADVQKVAGLKDKLGALPEFTTKAGKKFSADTREKLAAAHKAMKDGCDAMDALGYDGDKEDSADKGSIATLTKRATDAETELAKVKSELETLKDQPAPPKGVLTAVGRGDDVGGTEAAAKAATADETRDREASEAAAAAARSRF